jgi:TIR domain
VPPLYRSPNVILEKPMDWDVFISHASEDKAKVARPLTELLQRAGLKVWLDENELTLGDSLSRKIDEPINGGCPSQ